MVAGWGVVAKGLGEVGGVPLVSWEVAEHAEGYDAGELVVVGAVDDYVVVLVGEEPLFGEGSDGEGLVGVGTGGVDDVFYFDAFKELAADNEQINGEQRLVDVQPGISFLAASLTRV